MPTSENLLLQRFSEQGDAEAFAEVVRRHAGLVYGACLRVLGDSDRAADVVQETFPATSSKRRQCYGVGSGVAAQGRDAKGD